MSLSRAFKSKGWVGICIITLVFLFFISRNSFDSPQSTNKPKSSGSSSSTKHIGEAYNRLSSRHQQLLNSALAHVRLGYVANRTPDISTPPLLVLYSLHQQQTLQQHKTLDERLLDITNAYYFSMLQSGSAFAYDMSWPVEIEWYFEPTPSYMALSTTQAKFYKDKAEPHEIQYQVSPFTEDELLETAFLQNFADKGVKIVSTTDWSSTNIAWMTLRENPSMQAARDKYRLNHLQQKSDWFWLASRLLFSRPSGGWFSQQLEPYRDIMGGRLDYSEGYSPLDPQARKVTPEFASKRWFRIGLRVGNVNTDTEEMNKLVSHIAHLCQRQQKKEEGGSCHVFISAPNRDLLKILRNGLAKYRQQIAVHAVAEGFGFADLNQKSENNEVHTIFETDEHRSKRDYARTFMDWMILSRMDYLVGQQNDGFLKTAAWAAQVQTDISVQNGIENQYRIIPMSDW